MFDSTSERPPFPGFSAPNYTQVPDELFDLFLDQLSGAELKVVLYIIRRTFGFKKDSDAISLTQITGGITTASGRVLDHGTGLNRSTVVAALKGLVAKGLIIAERRASVEKGNEPTVYKLRMKTGEEATPLVAKNNQGESGNPTSPSWIIQPTRNRLTRNSSDDAVAASALVAFGLSRGIAAKIAGAYPSDYVMAKLELANWLLDQGSHLITRNAPGWLRRAIEEDYQAPAEYDRSPSETEPDGGEATGTTETPAGPPAEVTERQEAEGRMVEEKQATIQELRVVYPPRPIEGVGLTTQIAWQMALEELRPQVSPMAYRNWLTTAELVMANHERVTIAAPTQFQVEWLANRLDAQIAKALRSVLGRPVQCHYVTVRELLSPEGSSETKK